MFCHKHAAKCLSDGGWQKYYLFPFWFSMDNGHRVWNLHSLFWFPVYPGAQIVAVTRHN